MDFIKLEMELAYAGYNVGSRSQYLPVTEPGLMGRRAYIFQSVPVDQLPTPDHPQTFYVRSYLWFDLLFPMFLFAIALLELLGGEYLMVVFLSCWSIYGFYSTLFNYSFKEVIESFIARELENEYQGSE